MFAVRCFSLCAVDEPGHLAMVNPADWARAVPDLQRVFIAGELRGKGVHQLLPKKLPRAWLPSLSKETYYVALYKRLYECATALHTHGGRSMLLLPSRSATVLASRVSWHKPRTLPGGTLWNVVPDTDSHAAVYRLELILTKSASAAQCQL